MEEKISADVDRAPVGGACPACLGKLYCDTAEIAALVRHKFTFVVKVLQSKSIR